MLRKHIRKAPSAKQQVEKIEQHAEEAADERKYYGQDPNKAEIGQARSTMYHVQQGGDYVRGNEYAALTGKQGWLETYGQTFPGFTHFQEFGYRQRDKPVPHRGVRPPAALHPFYQAPHRKPFHGTPLRKDEWQEFKLDQQPLKFSRKLGPPTRWDESDLEEWSSDTSTRSQDFKYFRSRLRGDFEWELDRLNAQVLRYRKHKDKKKSRQLATKARENNERMDEEFSSGGYHQLELIEMLGLFTKSAGEDKHGIRQLNPVGWSIFRLRRALPLQYSFVIDVLVEEPKLSSDLEAWGRVKRGKKDKKIHKTHANLGTATAKDVNIKEDAAQNFKQTFVWTEQDQLPERIRIKSRQIINILSSMHGSSLCLDEDESSSVVLLRPFRILSAYDKEIRETCSTLREVTILEPESSLPLAVGKMEEKQPKSENAPGEEPTSIGEFLGTSDRTRAEDEEGKSRQEGAILDLEHLNCLRDFMDKYIGRRLAHLNSLSCSKIFFSDVWHLFQPGTTVMSAGGKQAYRVVSLKSKRHRGADRWASFWDRKKEKKLGMSDSSDELNDDTRADITIKCVSIHFDGKVFGPVIQTFQLNKWDGEKDVTYLDVYPIRFHVLKDLRKLSLTSNTKTATSVTEQDVEEGIRALRQRLIDRGRVFLDVAAVKQMYYSGLAVDTRDEIESQVMVDFEEALAHDTRKDWIPKITRLVGTDWNSKTDEADEGCTAECCWQENVHEDSYVETNNTEKFIDDMMAEIKDTPHKLPSAIIFPRTLEETKTDSNALTDDELMIMSYSVFGFVLRDRTWGGYFLFLSVHLTSPRNDLACNQHRAAKLDLDCMSPVRSPGSATDQTDDDLEEGEQGAFGQLVLPPGHKKMVLSLISQHFRNKESQESNNEQVDIVRGKGKFYRLLHYG